MSFKEQINSLSDQIGELEEESANLNVKAFELRQQRESLIAQMILDEKLLVDSEWDLTIDSSAGATLNYKDTSPNNMEVIKELVRTDWHSWFEISDGIQLRFDDNDISLSFKESKQMMPFVKKNGLKINGAGIKDRLAKLKRDVVSLETVCHSFNLL